MYGKFYSDIEEKYDSKLPAHGGLTFSDYVNGDFLIGFDCAHYRDMTLLEIANERAVYRDMAYVEDSLKKVVDFIEEHKKAD